MKKNVIIIILIILSLEILSGCTAESEEDRTFKANVAVCEYEIEPIQENILNAADNQDVVSFQYWCGRLQINAEASINMIKNKDVSSNLMSAKTGYLAYFDDLQAAGYYGKNGDVDNYISYYTKAVAHKQGIKSP